MGILSFLARQPSTISGHLYWRLASELTERVFSPDDDPRAVVERQAKMEADDRWICSRAAMLAGLLDLLFAADFETPAKIMAEAPAERQLSDREMTMVLGAPLRLRHFEAAAGEWRQLRAGDLSPQSLAAFECEARLARLSPLTP